MACRPVAELMSVYSYGLDLLAGSLFALRVLAVGLASAFVSGLISAAYFSDFVGHRASLPSL